MRVGIIGAGIGGTCLAHGLRRQGVEVVVFERNPAISSERPGYGIHINPFGQEALQECLPEENWRTFRAAARQIGGLARFYDTNLSLLAQQEGTHRKGRQIIRESRLSISRMELKDVLNQGLERVVRHQKQFVQYVDRGKGPIEVHFADGTCEKVDVLIGADGANSKLRKQYLPAVERFAVGVALIVGRTRLTPELAASLPSDLIDGSPNSLVPPSPDWMFVSVWRAPVSTAENQTDVQIDTYLVWAYITSAKNLPADSSSLSQESLRDLALNRTAAWNPHLPLLIRQSDLNSVSLVSLKSMPPLHSWRTTRVTVLGDSIHNMTPMAGVGANTALRDARLLSQALVAVKQGRIGLLAALRNYEHEMRKYANPAVALSLRNARNAGKGGLSRRFFRWLLRFAQAVVPFKKLLFPAGR